MADTHETVADIIAEKRALADRLEHEMAVAKECKELTAHRTAQAIIDNTRREADRLEKAHKREVDALKQRCAELDAEIAAKDEVIKRLDDALAEEQRRKMTTAENSSAVGNAVKLPDGWKMYDKYQIRHTDGTPLKGKRYFVLRLDSDDPLEAARVAAAMSAYKGETPQGNAAKLRETLCEILSYIESFHKYIAPRKGKRQTALFAVADTILSKARAALAAPPRNCDRPECATTKAAADVWRKEDGGKTAYYEWLLATYKEGGNDGR